MTPNRSGGLPMRDVNRQALAAINEDSRLARSWPGPERAARAPQRAAQTSSARRATRPRPLPNRPSRASSPVAAALHDLETTVAGRLTKPGVLKAEPAG